VSLDALDDRVLNIPISHVERTDGGGIPFPSGSTVLPVRAGGFSLLATTQPANQRVPIKNF
jgi:hypothetical protein